MNKRKQHQDKHSSKLTYGIVLRWSYIMDDLAILNFMTPLGIKYIEICLATN